MPRQTREKGSTERRAHAAAAEAGLAWATLADRLGGRSQDTLTRRLVEIDDGREDFPYETAAELVAAIVAKCDLRGDFFEMNFAAKELSSDEKRTLSRWRRDNAPPSEGANHE